MLSFIQTHAVRRMHPILVPILATLMFAFAAQAHAQSAYDLTPLAPQVRDAAVQARAMEAAATDAAARARAAAAQARASGVQHPQNGYGVDSGRQNDDFAGDVYEGAWSNGEYSGYGVYSYAINRNNPEDYSAALRYEGQYVNSIGNGLAIYYWRSGSRYAGQYVDGRRDGYGVYYLRDGTRFEGHYAHGSRNGYGVLWDVQGHLDQQGFWEDGKLATPASQ